MMLRRQDAHHGFRGRQGGLSAPSVDLQSAKTPPLPLSLGIVDDRTASALSITVTGTLQMSSVASVVASQQIHTQFVPGTKKMLRVALSASCTAMTCADGETCRLGTCVPVYQAGDDLPDWKGAPPPVSTEMNLEIEGATLWAGGWRNCASKGSLIYCWGDNEFGQMPGNFSPVRDRPIQR